MINQDSHDCTRVRIEAAKTDKSYANVISVILTISHSWMLHHKCDPYMFSKSVIAFVNLINVAPIVKALNLHSGIFIIEEFVPTFLVQGPSIILWKMGKQKF